MKLTTLGLAIMFGLAVQSAFAAGLSTPDVAELDDATISALDVACSSWVVTERKEELQDWMDAIAPLCTATKARPPKNPAQPVAATPGAGSATSAPAPSASSLGDKLQQLKALLDQGLISQADYDQTKAKLLTGFAN